MNSACGKVLLRKTLVRADARGGLRRQPNWADGFRKLCLSSQLHQLLLQLALDLAQLDFRLAVAMVPIFSVSAFFFSSSLVISVTAFWAAVA